jgi:hypothetical protein
VTDKEFIVSYSIAQKSGGSHEDDEQPIYRLSIEYSDETSERVFDAVSYASASEMARNHAKHSGYSKYLLNGRTCTV